MAYVKFVWSPNKNLVFTVHQPFGVGRGVANQPLPELRNTGYYKAIPLTDLVRGDVVRVNPLQGLVWEDEDVVYLTEAFVFYEGEQAFSDEDWVVDLDTAVNDTVVHIGDAVGAGEFVFNEDDDTGELTDLAQLLAGQSMFTVDEDETDLDTVKIVENL